MKQLGDILVEGGLVTNDQLSMAVDEQRKQGKALGRVLVEMGIVDRGAAGGLARAPDRPALRRPRRVPDRPLRGRAHPRCRVPTAHRPAHRLSTTASSSSRWPTRPTSSRWTTSAASPGWTSSRSSPPSPTSSTPSTGCNRMDSDIEDLTAAHRRGRRHARRPVQDQGGRRRRADRQVRQPADHPGDPGPRLGHPHRADRAGHARPLPHRRRAARDHALAEDHPVRRHLPPQDHGRDQHRRAAHPAGRPHERHCQGKKIDLRVATLPTVWGEKVVMRILDNSTAILLKLTDLGFLEDNFKQLRGELHQALRDDPGHRTDRVGQVDDALRDAQHRQHAERKHASRSRTRSSTASRASTRCRPT